MSMRILYVLIALFVVTGALASEHSFSDSYVPNPANPPKYCDYESSINIYSKTEVKLHADDFMLMSCVHPQSNDKFARLWWMRLEELDFKSTPYPVYNNDLKKNGLPPIHVVDEVIFPVKDLHARLYECQLKGNPKSKAIAAVHEPLNDSSFDEGGNKANTFYLTYALTSKNAYGAWVYDQKTDKLVETSIDSVECDIHRR